MLTVELSEFMVQLTEGAIQNIGPSTKSATVKLYDVERAEARAFGDERVKLVFEDEEDNLIEVALFPDEVEGLLAEIDGVRASGDVEGFPPADEPN